MTVIMRPKNQTFRGGSLGGGAHQKLFVNLGGILRIFLCNFTEFIEFIYEDLHFIFNKEMFFWGGRGLGGQAPPPEEFCEFRGVFEDFCIRFLIM